VLDHADDNAVKSSRSQTGKQTCPAADTDLGGPSVSRLLTWKRRHITRGNCSCSGVVVSQTELVYSL